MGLGNEDLLKAYTTAGADVLDRAEGIVTQSVRDEAVHAALQAVARAVAADCAAVVEARLPDIPSHPDPFRKQRQNERSTLCLAAAAIRATYEVSE